MKWGLGFWHRCLTGFVPPRFTADRRSALDACDLTVLSAQRAECAGEIMGRLCFGLAGQPRMGIFVLSADLIHVAACSFNSLIPMHIMFIL
jgi:hypothetical protein